ncbi:MAG: hypothetical protein LBH24_04535 [Clostridiales bacterium]|jgi:hypothetical protein|nr:hypothetical protein [Clostridiales bacterium]
METIVKSVGDLFTRYGARSALVILLTIVLVNLIKKPVYKKAGAYLAAKGCDKNVVTRYVTLLPVPVAFVLDLAAELFATGFALGAIVWPDMLSRAVLYGGLAIATYEGVKKQLQAYAAQKTAAQKTAAPPADAEPADDEQP